MKKVRLQLLMLSVLFAALMSAPFLVPKTGPAILFGFVPLLFMDIIADAKGVRHFWWWHYFAFVLWNACTTFWVCNATVGGGVFAVLANAFQMSLIFAVFRFSKKKLGVFLSYVFLIAMWIAWERFYFSAEISWPWLTLGNAFAQTTRLCQWYEYTGTVGGSLWIWACNLGAFYILLFLLGNHFKDMRKVAGISLVAGYLIILLAPAGLSLYMYDNFREEDGESLDVIIGQPNFDPYQKFSSMTQEQQNEVLLDLFREELQKRPRTSAPLLLLAPETFTSDIVTNRIQSSKTFQTFRSFLRDYPNTTLLFGSSTYEYIFAEEAPSYTVRKAGDGVWVQTHNSAFATDSTGREEFYHKSRLVVGTEKMPYPKVLSVLDDKMGGVMGRCTGQDEPSLLTVYDYDAEGNVRGNFPVGCAICYESIYGEYCTGYVKKGARALAVITNDAWWGDTPGYMQHMSYSSLRAIETRRDVARCGNTGISAIINQRGDVVSQSDWWQRQTVSGKIYMNDRETFFVKNGDIAGRVCTFMFLLLALALLVRLIIRK